MPDLITHISFNYIIYKIVKKRLSLFLILFGAILPDLFSAMAILLSDLFKLYDRIEQIIAYMVPSHSIFIAGLLSVAIGIVIKPSRMSIPSLFSGYLLHLFLDLLQDNYGGGILLFYPFFFRTYSLKLFTYGVGFKYIYTIIPIAIFSLFIFREKGKETILFNPKFTRITLSLLLLISAVGINIIFFNKTVKSNTYFINFRFDPAKYHNTQITINKHRPIKTDPVMIRFRRHLLTLKNVKIKVYKDKWYYIKGIYDHRERSLHVIKMIDRPPYMKAIISGVGLLMFMFFLIFKIKIRKE